MALDPPPVNAGTMLCRNYSLWNAHTTDATQLCLMLCVLWWSKRGSSTYTYLLAWLTLHLSPNNAALYSQCITEILWRETSLFAGRSLLLEKYKSLVMRWELGYIQRVCSFSLWYCFQSNHSYLVVFHPGMFLLREFLILCKLHLLQFIPPILQIWCGMTKS